MLKREVVWTYYNTDILEQASRTPQGHVSQDYLASHSSVNPLFTLSRNINTGRKSCSVVKVLSDERGEWQAASVAPRSEIQQRVLIKRATLWSFGILSLGMRAGKVCTIFWRKLQRAINYDNALKGTFPLSLENTRILISSVITPLANFQTV